ncbi:MAG: thioredoxin family protein [Vampirovibrionales bacterium]|nr:thioredoxin family protein [Vampirovibrionales bacterium]
MLVWTFRLLSAAVLGSVLFLLPSPALAESTLPQLTPALLQQAGVKAKPTDKLSSYVMLDFFSQYCGVCQQAEPYLKEIQKQLQADVRFVRVDADKKEALARQFHVEGTPTYILFDAQGKALYRMHRYISMEVLYTQLERFTGKIQPKVLPPELLPQTLSSAYTLIAIHPKGCVPCEAKKPYLNAMTFATEAGNDLTTADKTKESREPGRTPGLTIIEWDPANPEASRYLQEFKWPEGQGYVLLDPSARELLQATGDIDPQILWKNIRLLSDTGL